MIQVIDYKAGNLTSVVKALRYLGPAMRVTLGTGRVRLRPGEEVEMQQTAKLYSNGSEQVITLPEGFRFDGEEVTISKDPDTGNVILSQEPKSLSNFLKLLEEVGPAEPDFLAERDTTTPPDRNLF